MSLTLRWRVLERRIVTRWRGPAGMTQAVERDPTIPVAALIGPPGPAGPSAAPLRLDASLAATWVLPHPFGRVPTVQVFLGDGESVLTDLVSDPAQITVTFPSPQQGFVLAF